MSSGVKRVAAPPVPGGTGLDKKHVSSPSANGSGPAPLMYSSGETTDDVNMNEVDEKLDLNVILPSGKSTVVTVDSNIPMIDLLVHLAAKSKVSPSGHTLQILDEEKGKSLDYTPNQTIGSLGAITVYLVPKNKKPDWNKANKAVFEITQRFTINLPGGQKTVMRISPNLTLEQVLLKVCQEKHLEAWRYTFQHLTNPLTSLNMKSSVSEYRLTEINLIPAGMSPAATDYARSMPDLSKGGSSYDYSMAYMPETGETKKKRGLLSFLKKDKKFKPPTIQHSAEARLSTSQQKSMPQAHKSTTPPPERRSGGSKAETRPKTMYVSDRDMHRSMGATDAGTKAAILKPPPHEAGKKRPAPLPPGTREASEASIHTPASSAPGRDNTAVRETVSTGPKAGPDVMISRLHSRNSSDSSGYHELTLSGTESPEASRLRPNFKTSIDTTSIESTDANGDSGIQEVSPGSGSSPLSAEDVYAVPMKSKAKQQTQQSVEKLKPIPSTKKKKAPPPPSTKVPAPQEVTVSVPSVLQESFPLSAAAASSVVTDAIIITNHCATPMPEEQSYNQVIEEPEIKEHPTLDREEAEEPFSLEDILEVVDLDDESPFKVIDEPDEQWDDDEQEKQFMMVETASVLSEDVQVPEDFRQRPCAFNPPPPPLEPPPDYSPLESRKFADKSTIVGEDNASLAPLSLKSSPVARDRDYKNEMAVFHEKNKAAEADEDEFSNNISGSLQDTDSVSDSGSVIQHDVPYHYRRNSFDSHSSQSSFGQANNYGENEDSFRPEPDNSHGTHQNSVLENEFAMTEEIEAPVEMVPPPLEFQNSEDAEDEEEVVTVTEEYIVPLTSKGFDFAASVKITDLNTPNVDVFQSKTVDSTSSISVFQTQTIDVVNPTPAQNEDNATIKKPVKESPPKEEFVLTTEDLKNVSLLPLRPKLYSRPKTERSVEYKQPKGSWLTDIVLDEPRERPHVHLAYASERSQQKKTTGGSPSLAQKQIVADSKTSSGSWPVAKGDQPSFALPSMRITSILEPPAFSDDDASSENTDDHRYQSTAKLLMENHSEDVSSLTDDSSERQSSTSSRHLSDASSSSSSSTVGELHSDLTEEKYQQLQQNLARWQEQLRHNQVLLAQQSDASALVADRSNKLQAMQLEIRSQQQKPPKSLQEDPTPSPPHPPSPLSAPKLVKTWEAAKQQRPPAKKFEPQLDPREELMIAIRSFGGHEGLSTSKLGSDA